jgi:hypothetical protein
MKKSKWYLLAILFSVIVVQGCGDKLAGPVVTQDGNVLVNSKVISTTQLQGIQITSAKMIISNVEFVDVSGNSYPINKKPFVTYFEVSGGLSMMIAVFLPGKSYQKIRFQIHKYEDGDNLQDPEFNEGPDANHKYSFIIKGRKNGNYFEYKSKTAVNMELVLTNPVRIENTQINLTMTIDKFLWFIHGGIEVDPEDPNNENIIDNNIRSSFVSVN